MRHRVCNKCRQEKVLSDFYLNKYGYLGRRSVCKQCTHVYNTSQATRERGRVRRQEERKDPNYRVKQRLAEEKYRTSDKARSAKRERHYIRYNEDVEYRLRCVLRSRLLAALKGRSKKGSAVLALGCSMKEFRKYLEALWEPNWSWDNYGDLWEIDHIIPLSSVDLLEPEQVNKVCHYSNLRPLSLRENRGRN